MSHWDAAGLGDFLLKAAMLLLSFDSERVESNKEDTGNNKGKQ